MRSLRTVSSAVRGRAALLLVLALSACATARGIMALRQVAFEVDRVEGIRLAGVALDHVRRVEDISMIGAARVGAAIAQHRVPLEFDVHVLGRNPEGNATTARLLRLQWVLDLNGRETVHGTIDSAYTFAPGEVTDVRVPVQLDLWQFFQGSASDALELALGLTGFSARRTEIAIRAVPTIDTPLGPIEYPTPITIVRRTVGGP